MSIHQEKDLTQSQVENFIEHGFVKLEAAFDGDLARDCRDELWADIGLSQARPETFTKPVFSIGSKSSPPFIAAANTPQLHAAYDSLVGEGRWLSPHGLGTFPIRFRSNEHIGDHGWHVDMGFGTENPDFMKWRANVKSRSRALLMLFLFSDVGPDDAPNCIRKSSHATIARELLPHGQEGATLGQLSADGYASTEDCDVALATGSTGTVYLCHPLEPDSKLRECCHDLARWRVTRRMWAMSTQPSALAMDFSQSFERRRHRPSHARVRSTTQRRGRISKPSAVSERLTI